MILKNLEQNCFPPFQRHPPLLVPNKEWNQLKLNTNTDEKCTHCIDTQ